MKRTFFLLILTLSPQTFAGYFEIGSSYNYRENHVDEDNYTLSRSITASVSYYFWEQSAIELSYTDGTTDIRLDTVDVNVKYQMYGADLIISFAEKDAWFKPYVKFGAVYQDKSTRTEYEDTPAKTVKSSGTSPSVGAGFRLIIGGNFVIRAGVDAWASPNSNGTDTYDLVGRAGVSWIF